MEFNPSAVVGCDQIRLLSQTYSAILSRHAMELEILRCLSLQRRLQSFVVYNVEYLELEHSPLQPLIRLKIDFSVSAMSMAFKLIL